MKKELNYIQSVKLLINSKFSDIISTELVLVLMRVYSDLYLNKRGIGGCSRCLRNAYNEILKSGTEMAIKYEELKKRICKPLWNGNKYIPKMGRHYSNIYITDNEAIMLLSKGFLKESDFEILPIIEKKELEIKENITTITPEKKQRNKKKSK